ncbi:non-ribosomal peptide synthase [Legionella quinlivanii]|uniref:Non-ribosomal peptide synthase n=1 Tax=Legionella quinlivanii TaxID=45073 RepID=A0A0W0XN55_9GAMM|nr:non-ribosomal peptide synthetase [Legionella quinlivanii]KTD46057.1 non-ribosomal peptide synthase [Legionella quinlivanii]SEG46900.1 amino acid adenylation domain-containing protein [Legionella quinlivanii DSM 21216]STY10008.1 non-ribosomal peptide synthase [Legionella quinlivanii]
MIKEIISLLAKNGIQLSLKGSNLAYRAPKGALTDELRKLVAENKLSIIHFLQSQNKVISTPQPCIMKRGGALSSQVPLSFAQQRLWLLNQIDNSKAHYNMPNALKLSGSVNLEVLNRTFNTILERHEILRTCFLIDAKEQPYQQINPTPDFSVTVHDISSLEEDRRNEKIAELMVEETSRPFELSSDIMIRASLIKEAQSEYTLLVTMHHIVSDAWSMPILVREFSTLYSAYLQGKDNPLNPPLIQYSDYADWQHNWFQGEVVDEQLNYWEKQLANLPIIHNVPLDHTRPNVKGFSGKTFYAKISNSTRSKLHNICHVHGATLFMALHALFAAFLSRYSNEYDIVIGSPIANRDQPEVTDLIGCFINVLVLRSDLSNKPSFIELLQQSKSTLFDAYMHQQVPFEKIVERLQPNRSLSHSPLFQIMLVLENIGEEALDLPGLRLNVMRLANTYAKYDLTLTVRESSEELQLGWTYDTNLFDASTIERMAAHFNILLSSVLSDPDESVFDVNMISTLERHQLLTEWAGSAINFTPNKCVHEIFEAIVCQHPHSKAIFTDSISLSYEALNSYANGLAHDLLAANVTPGDVVPVMMETGIEIPLAYLAIMKAGAIFAPIDLRWPADRIQAALSKLKPKIVLADNSVSLELTSRINVYVVDLRYTKSLPDNLELSITPDNPIYIFHTSGSTGQPKGAINLHKGIVNRLAYMNRFFFNPKDQAVMLMTHHCFDSCIWQIFWPLMSGGSCYIPDKNKNLDIGYVIDSISRHKITMTDFTPALFSIFVDELCSRNWPADTLSHLKALIIGGEAITVNAARKFKQAYPTIDLINGYGPTETSIGMLFYRLPQVPLLRIPIGKPIANVSVYVLDQNRMPVPVGVPGELFITGVCLGAGYWMDTIQTEKVFIDNPFYLPGNPASSERMYKTGDLVRWLPDGNLEFLGRTDQQVKVRGFRIELGEIEKNLIDHDSVKEAIVQSKETSSGDKYLVAYIVFNEGGHLDRKEDIDSLRTYLAKQLPDYMVPSVFMLLEHIPLTLNGKVNRKALPDPDLATQKQQYVAPRSKIEKKICEIWQDILGIERIGVTDNFFELGGHSLTATQVVARISKTFNVALPIKSIFTGQTPKHLAQTVLELDIGIDQPPVIRVERERLMLPSFAQQRLWLLDIIDGGSSHYNMPSAFRLYGHVNLTALQRAFSAIVERHESLRTTFTLNESGELCQVIQPNAELTITQIDLTQLDGSSQQTKLKQIMLDESNRSFSLDSDLMLRVQLIALAENEHVLLATMHHIASDGWSVTILFNEFSTLYSAFVKGETNPLPPLEIQYADYAHWQRNWLNGGLLEKQISWWEKQLTDLPVSHGLPLDRSRPNIQSFAGAKVYSHVGKRTTKALSNLCQKYGATLFMGLHAAFSALLSRYSNEYDIVMGTPVANREQEEVSDLIGFFVNAVVLRINLSDNPSFCEILERSKGILIDAYMHQQAPFEQIVERIQPERHTNHAALFQIVLALQGNHVSSMELPGLSITPLIQANDVAKYDLTLFVTESKDCLSLTWEYNTDLFDSLTIEEMSRHFSVFLDSLTNTPHARVSSIRMVNEQECEELLNLGKKGNELCVRIEPRLLHSRFLEQVKIRGSKIAVKTSKKSLTYELLWRMSGALAHSLIQSGCSSNKLVAILMEKGWEQVVAVLGIVRAGAAYLPIDAHLPEDRIRLLLELGEITQVVTTSEFEKILLAGTSLSIFTIDSEFEHKSMTNIPMNGLDLRSSPSDLAYVIFTSGSSGVPKGVMISHEGAANTIDDLCMRFNLTDTDTVLALSNLNFDLSVFDIFGLLSVGGTIVIPQEKETKDVNAWERYLEMESITIWNTVPAYMQILTKLDTKSVNYQLRLIMMAGDWIPTDLPSKIGVQFPNAIQISLGGNTEASIFSCIYYIDKTSKFVKSVPYGKALTNQHLFVFSSDLRPAPYGVVGEIYIGGVGVSLGYWRDDAQTKSSFIVHPDTGDRLFKTGDLGRLLRDGNIEFIGRKDFQVKVRGFRIELGEVDCALLSHKMIKDAVTIVKDSNKSSGILVAYVVLHKDISHGPQSEVINSLRQHLGKKLPEYMVPAAFVLLDSMPLTPNGKVDRKSLPEPAIDALKKKYVAPRNEIEEILCEKWQEVLGVERIGITDNFFELGGHSLLVMKLVESLQHHHITMTAHQLFVTPILMDLALSIENSIEHKVPSLKTTESLIPTGCEHITPAMLQLVSLSPEEIDLVVNQVPGGVGNIKDIYSLGPLQEGVLFHHRVKKNGDPYVLCDLFKIKSKPEVDKFLDALQFIINRYDVLRTIFLWENLSTPVQVVCRQAELPVSWIKLEAESDCLKYMQDLCAPELQQMDLNQAPLLRSKIVHDFNSEEYIILLQYHHIIFDHIGIEVIRREVLFYQAGLGDNLTAVVPYSKFIAHVLNQVRQGDAVTHFQKNLAGIDQPSTPFNLVDIQTDSSEIIELQKIIPLELCHQIRKIAKDLKVSPAVIFHAVWAMVVASCCGSNDVVFGTLLSGRLQGVIGAERMLGLFINTLPLRVKLDGCSAVEIIKQVQNSLQDLIYYEQTPLVQAQKCANLPFGSPLFSAILNYRHSAPVELGEILHNENGVFVKNNIEHLSSEEYTHYPFDLSVTDYGVEFKLTLCVDCSVSAERVLSYVQTSLEGLVHALLEMPNKPVKEIPILPQSERHQILVEWNDIQINYPKDRCIHQLFEEHVIVNPNAIALVFEEHQLTYRELNEKANQLAHYLVTEHHVKPDTLVGICVERSIDMVVSIIAILKAGGAYVPLDPNYPNERLNYILNDAKPTILLTKSHILLKNPIITKQTICLDDEVFAQQLTKQPTNNLDAQLSSLNSSHLAYIVYTSGSTGQPKGVMIEHENVVSLVCNSNYLPLGPSNIVAQASNMSFDAMTFELWGALLNGAKLVIINKDSLIDASKLQMIIHEQKVDTLFLTTALLNLFSIIKPDVVKDLKYLLFGGEDCSLQAVKKIMKHSAPERLLHVYGPTENTTFSLWKQLTPNYLNTTKKISLGKGLSSRNSYVLDKEMNLVPIGVKGELYLGGSGLARGYLNQPVLTAEKFVMNPFYDAMDPNSSTRIYKTGDLVRWLPCGDLEFLGRVDQQVKIRGFRIELGEIQSVLLADTLVNDAVVLATETLNGDKRIVAYVVVSESAANMVENNDLRQKLINSLRHNLKQVLPDYMLPSEFILIDKFPLTVNGKVDLGGLPKPDLSKLQAKYIAPLTETEIVLSKIWQDILELERVGITDNFFELGGHSLQAVELNTRIEAKFNISLPLKILFEFDDLKSLASYLDVINEASL